MKQNANFDASRILCHGNEKVKVGNATFILLWQIYLTCDDVNLNTAEIMIQHN